MSKYSLKFSIKTLGYNLAGKKPDMQSEVYEGAMNCMAVVHRDSKLIVGKNFHR